jgi:cytochrome c-type biogenesis protein
MDSSNLTFGFAFLAGLASFLSPCVFALVPAYIGYLSGRSVASANKEGENNSWITFTHGLAFVLGFSVVFVLLGILFSALGGVLNTVTDWLVRIGGIVIIIFGLHMTGIIRIPFLEYDLRPESQPDRRRGYLSSAMMGVFFSAGWSPCVGPVLGAILTLAYSGSSISQGALLLAAYSAGLGIPFLLAAMQIGWVTAILRKYGKVMHYAEIVMGVLLIIVGVLLFLGKLSTFANLGTFFSEAFDEIVVGRMILIGVVSSLLLGLIPAYIAKQRGKNFVDWWFLGSGLILIFEVVLFFLGAIDSLVMVLS